MKKAIIIIFIFFTILLVNNSANCQVWLPFWSNNYNSWLGNHWYIQNNDCYLQGNFTLGSSSWKVKNEILCINPNNNYSMILNYTSSWVSNWSNSGSAYIGDWHINSNDKYFTLASGNSTLNKSRVLAINYDNGYAMLLYPNFGYHRLGLQFIVTMGTPILMAGI